MLEHVHIFAGLPREELETLERHVVMRSFPKNAVVLMEGETGATRSI